MDTMTSPASPLPSAMLTVAAVARRLGVAPATLRTWDRRYGLGPSEHTSGAHRRYGPSDVARLETMRRLTRAGVSPAEAARVASAATAEPEEGAAPPTPPTPARGTGGRVIAMPAGTRAARGLARAAMALDATTATEVIKDALRRRGVVSTWEQVVVPVLEGVGRRWAATGEGVEVEHLLSECLVAAVHTELLPVRTPANPRPVFLAAAEEEQHTLPLYALAAALAERQIGALVLGARLPRAALADAVRRTGPAAVFVWSQLPATGDPDQLAAIPAQRPAARLVVGGPGWHSTPAGTVRADHLAQAVEIISEAVGA
jgi:MerR family transcriptional regulator, light-induced transcriptional regulator